MEDIQEKTFQSLNRLKVLNLNNMALSFESVLQAFSYNDTLKTLIERSLAGISFSISQESQLETEHMDFALTNNLTKQFDISNARKGLSYILVNILKSMPFLQNVPLGHTLFTL